MDIIVAFLEKTFPFIANLMKKRQKAIDIAYGYFNVLISELNRLSNKPDEKFSNTDDENNNFILLNQPVKYFDTIFSSSNYKLFVKYGLIVKKFQDIINRLSMICIVVSLLLATILYFIFKNIIISIVVGAILLLVSYYVIKTLTKGETYNEFYEKTIYKLIFLIVPEYKITNNAMLNIDSNYLKNIVKFTFDHYNYDNKVAFESNYIDGELFNMVIKKNYKTKNKDGTITTNTNTVFDGFNITLRYKNSFGFLKGSTINIRDDDTVLSLIAEDSVQSMFQNDREFTFNSEELNKAFDCFIGGVNSFGDIDSLMETIHRVITPTFEEQLLFLKRRFNTFNMTLTDNMINFNVNMTKSTFQKVKSGELFEFKSKYRDYIKTFALPSSGSSGYKDFMYYKMFPPAEKLFYILYFDNLIRTYLDRDNMKIENIDIIKAFQTSDLEIAEMYYDEFKKKYEDNIQLLYEESKNIEINLEKEVL